MQTQVYKTKTAVKRMDVVAEEHAQSEHEEVMSKARRAVKKAQRTSAMAEELIREINRYV